MGATSANATSSRSHSICMVTVTGRNSVSGASTFGKLHLVDLAGSERLDKSGAVGAALKETQAINKSLSSLADVFAAKANHQSHVPFRNSKLTHLLSNALRGKSKTLMFVNISPLAKHYNESVSSLRSRCGRRAVPIC